MRLVKLLQSFRNSIYTDLIGGPKLIQMRYVINFYKCLTFFWVLLLMFYFNNWSENMLLYLCLHGSYGMFWFIKDVFFGDSSWKQKATFPSLIMLATVLSIYWMIPLPIATLMTPQSPAISRIVFIITLYVTGVILMMGSDYQKTITLKKRKGLISNGFFRRTRNPNYLGQLLIYTSFAVTSGHLYSYLIIMSVCCPLFALNVYIKDKLSYQCKSGWDQYRKHSYIFFPKILQSDMLNYVMYGVLALIVCYFVKFDLFI